MAYRIEHDSLGGMAVPDNAYYGVHTQRALTNFDIGHEKLYHYPTLIQALAYLKAACAQANAAEGLLAPEKAAAIETACQQLLAGQHHDQFVLDVLQGGAGTSTNMNANEVIANLALESLGFAKAAYSNVHPNDDVNMGQSTNDVYPSALRLALLLALPDLLTQLAALAQALEARAADGESLVKIGRTQLQEAVPLTVAQDLRAHAAALQRGHRQLQQASHLLYELNLGGTAIGTGINTTPGFAPLALAALTKATGLPLTLAPDKIAATQDVSDFAEFSGVLKRVALTLSKFCNDLRLLSSGPRSGFCEFLLPAKQAGSSIMPGKVNPVIPEVVNQIAFEIMGNDVTIGLAAEAGQLQLNAFEPVIGWSLLKGLQHLTHGVETLRVNCVEGLRFNVSAIATHLQDSAGVATALVPHLGYEVAARLAKEAQVTGTPVFELARRQALADDETLARWLAPESLTRPNL